MKLNLDANLRKLVRGLDDASEHIWKDMLEDRRKKVSVRAITATSAIQLALVPLRLTGIKRRQSQPITPKAAQITRSLTYVTAGLSGFIVALGVYELGRQYRERQAISEMESHFESSIKD